MDRFGGGQVNPAYKLGNGQYRLKEPKTAQGPSDCDTAGSSSTSVGKVSSFSSLTFVPQDAANRVATIKKIRISQRTFLFISVSLRRIYPIVFRV